MSLLIYLSMGPSLGLFALGPSLGPALGPALGVPAQTEACLLALRTLVSAVDLHAITGFPCSQLCSGSCPGQRKLWKFHAPEIQETRFAGDFFHTSISFQRAIRSTFAIARWLKIFFLLKFKLFAGGQSTLTLMLALLSASVKD